MSGPTLSVIVPASDDPPTLKRCRAAVEAQLGPGDELIAVTTASLPGPAAARNEGASRAAGAVLVFVDADVVVGAAALERIRQAFSLQPDLAAVFGSYDAAPEGPGLTSQFRNLLHHHTHQGAGGEVSSFWAGLGAVSADRFAAVGGFDSDRFARPSVEDIELGLRLADAGERIVLDPGLQGTHLKAWGLLDMLRTDLADRGAPWIELMLERGELRSELNLGPRNRLSALAAIGTTLALPLRSGMLAVVALGTLVAANVDLYRLLGRKLGTAGAAAAVGLHLAHLLAAVLAVPLGALRWLRRRPRR